MFGQVSSWRNTKKRPSRNINSGSAYELLETRKVLASLFPTYINGQFTLGNGPDADSPYDLADTFELSSLPSSTKTIYIDNTGHHSVDNNWGHDIMFDPFDTDGDPSSFSNDELIEIQLQFQNMAEDYLPFGVNITTKEPSLDALLRSDANDDVYGIRLVNTQPTSEFGGFCGIAFLNSFGSDIDNPVFTVCKGDKNGALIHSHETGHALGLRHDGLNGAEYHPGAGSGVGADSWGPIMGAPFGYEITQWSNGDYTGSTNLEDDFSVITQAQNGFGFRPDDFGNSINDAFELTGSDDGDVFLWGIVEKNSDVDVFEFTTSAGDAAITVNAFGEAANLDVLAKILDEDGNLLHFRSPTASQDAVFDVYLPGGKYYLTVEGTGQDDLYSDYGSVGLYTIEGVVNIVTGLPVGETGRLENLNDRWITVDFLKEYDDPVVVAGPVSRRGGDAVNVRIRNVTATSFDIHIDEWEYRDGRHGRETVDYMVVEAGEYELEDGTKIMAGNRYNQTNRWTTNSLSDAFAGGPTPILLAQTITENDPTSVTTRLRYVSGTEFQVRLQEEQSLGRGIHGRETVSWIAIQENVGQIGTVNFEAAREFRVTHRAHSFDFQNSYQTPPAFLAAMQTTNGGDTATVRYTSLTSAGASIFLEEERSLDNETFHGAETVGYVAIELGQLLGSSAELRPSISGYEYDDLVGNLSRFRGDYPDYSKALELVRARNEEGHQHSLGHDLADYDELDRAKDFDRNFVTPAEVQKAADHHGERLFEDESTTSSDSINSLSGSITDNGTTNFKRSDWFNGIQSEDFDYSELDLAFELDLV